MIALALALALSPAAHSNSAVEVNCRGFQKFPEGVTISVPAAKNGFFRSLPLAENAGFDIFVSGRTLRLKLWAEGEESVSAESADGNTSLNYGPFQISCQIL